MRVQCRAVAAAIFDNNSDDKVEYATLDGYRRFLALQDGRVDLLARSTTHTMERALNEVRMSYTCTPRYEKLFLTVCSFSTAFLGYQFSFPKRETVVLMMVLFWIVIDSRQPPGLVLLLVSLICTLECNSPEFLNMSPVPMH
jgi:hypothetical protein